MKWHAFIVLATAVASAAEETPARPWCRAMHPKAAPVMAWARVWLGAHHLSDVLAAVILWVSVAVAVCRNPDQRAV